MNMLTENFQKVCRKLVQEQLPHEASLFDHIWAAFWGALNCEGIEELEKRYHVSGEVSPVCVLGAVNTGRQELDTLFVLGAFVNTMVSIQRTPPKGEVTIDIIADTLKRECLNIDTPDHLQSVLFGHGVGLLAGLLNVEVPADQIADAIPAEQLWVEYQAEDRKPQNLGGEYYDSVYVEKQFRKKRGSFDIFVDETESKMWILGRTDNPLELPYLADRLKGMLWLLLRATDARIRHKEIKSLFNITVRDGADRIYQYLFRLRELLGTELCERVIRKGKNQQYLIHESGWSFCWIRQDRNPRSSILLDDVG